MSDLSKSNQGKEHLKSSQAKTIVENKYWQDVENKVLDSEELSKEFKDNEFDSFSVTKSRRNFLKIMGFTVGAMPLTGCIKIPVRKAIPYLNKIENQYPGVPNYYASTYNNTPVVIKTREGRPIYVKGNKLSSVTQGGINAPAIASVLSLYDSGRYRSPQINSTSVEWNEFDQTFISAVKKAASTGKELYIVTPTVKSPSFMSVLGELNEKFGVKHLAYEAYSQCALSKANEETFSTYAPSIYDFSKADVIVSFGADFLGTWGDDVKNSKEYSSRRVPEGDMSRHIQLESIMSLTGTNADIRYTKSVSDQREIIKGVYETLSGKSLSVDSSNQSLVKKIVNELRSAKTSLIISGDDHTSTQVIINKINDLLGNYGKSLKVTESSYVKYADNAAVKAVFDKAAKGNVAGLFFYNVNPAYNFYDRALAKKAIEACGLSVSFALSEDETSKLCKFVAPGNHAFESWGDSLIGLNEVSFIQPVIQPLFGSRMVQESLLKLLEKEGTYYDYIKSFWQKSLYPLAVESSGFTNFWNKSLHDGVALFNNLSSEASSKTPDVSKSYNELKKLKRSNSSLNIVLYQKYGVRNGDHANNPWLQELPDPVTKATWDNYAMISPLYAKENGIKSGDVLEIKSQNHTVKLPALVQPGVDKGTIGLAVGYGRTIAGRVASGLGENVYPFATFVHGHICYKHNNASIKKTGSFKGLAQTQTHHSMEGRDIVRETTFEAFKNDKSAGNKKPMKLAQIYPGHVQGGHQWAMAIDMNSCTGCSSCIVSCNSENNVPVVGRAEVKNRREMHWLRIDRYYSGDENEPETVHMPMLCQHCENAPCENVCPVLATVHSSDGINQQIYNRCVGTRYCANNCPYKVRRFNWFNYDHSDEYERLALNPDVSIRSRGVMEKCSFCIQRIQGGKLQAKKERRALKDGDVVTACQEGCPSDAIVFGDMKDENSKIYKMLNNKRKYVVLEELNVKPRVNYMVKVRNK